MNGTCEAKECRMKKYLNKVSQLVKKFKEDSFVQLPKGAMDEFDKVQYMPSIDLPKV